MTVMEALEYRIDALAIETGKRPRWLPITRPEKERLLSELSAHADQFISIYSDVQFKFSGVQMRVVSEPGEIFQEHITKEGVNHENPDPNHT